MASEILREVCIAGKEIDFENLADTALAPVESFCQLMYRNGVVEVEDASAADVANVLGALLNHARETILRAGGIAITSLALFLSLTLATPTEGHAEEFFDSQAKAQKLVDGTLAEGMAYGHYGLLLKVVQFTELGETGKDASMRSMMNKVAWYNAVNAHRMLDSALPSIQNPDTRGYITNQMKLFDVGMATLGKRFGWNSSTTAAMYNKTRGLIEARIADLRRTAFKQ